MKKEINRRSFIKNSGWAGAAVVSLGSFFPTNLIAKKTLKNPDIAVVNGESYYSNTFKAVELLGGMKSFVGKRAKVGLLINSDFEIFGTYTSPDVSIAVVKMCFEAGASQVVTLQNVKPEYWERSSYYESHKKLIGKIKNMEINQFPSTFDEENFLKIQVPGVTLKEAEVLNELFDVDILINLPVAKHHASTGYTGALKNMMGITTRETNVGFHLNSGVRNDPVFLGQCIADLNLLRKSDLIITDATEVLTTNGPMGPGMMKKPLKIVAGTDIVGVDTYCTSLIGKSTEEVPSLKYAEAAKLGTMNLDQLNIQEV